MSNLIDDVLANPIVGAAGTSLAVAGVALWIAAAWWAWRDAGRRTESTVMAFLAAAWIIVSTPMLLPLSLLIYSVARPQVAVAETRAESLAARLAASAAAGTTCPGCETRIDPGWVRCPLCAAWLAAPCTECGEWSPADLDICPYCAHEGRATPAVAATAATHGPAGQHEWRAGLGAAVARHSGVQP